MKTQKVLTILSFLGVSIIAGNRALAQVPQTAVDSATEIRQGETINNGTTTTVKAPTRFSGSTADLLLDLAKDETLAVNWFNTDGKVPANAKVVVTFAGPGDFSSLSYKVVSGTKSVDVSNVLTAVAGTNVTPVTSSSFADANGAGEPPFTSTDYQQYTITYDGRAVGGRLHFTITGLATATTKTTKPNARTGVYTETDSFSLADGTGSGVDAFGTVFAITGATVTASGSEKLNCECGTDEVGPAAVGGQAAPGTGDTYFGAGDEQSLAPPPGSSSSQVNP